MDDLQQRSRLVVHKRFGLAATTYLVRGEGRFGHLVAQARQSHDRGEPLRVMTADGEPTATVHALDGAYGDYSVDAADGTSIGVIHPVVLQADTGVRSSWEIRPVGRMPLEGTDHTSLGAVRTRYADYFVGGGFKVARSALPFDFRFGPDGRALRVRRRAGLRDRYVLEIGSAELDRRLAIAQTVVLSVFEEQNLLNTWRSTRRLFSGR